MSSNVCGSDLGFSVECGRAVRNYEACRRCGTGFRPHHARAGSWAALLCGDSSSEVRYLPDTVDKRHRRGYKTVCHTRSPIFTARVSDCLTRYESARVVAFAAFVTSAKPETRFPETWKRLLNPHECDPFPRTFDTVFERIFDEMAVHAGTHRFSEWSIATLIRELLRAAISAKRPGMSASEVDRLVSHTAAAPITNAASDADMLEALGFSSRAVFDVCRITELVALADEDAAADNLAAEQSVAELHQRAQAGAQADADAAVAKQQKKTSANRSKRLRQKQSRIRRAAEAAAEAAAAKAAADAPPPEYTHPPEYG